MAERKPVHLIALTKTEKSRFKGKRAEHVRYDPEIATYICEQVALGRSLRRICMEPDMPTPAAVLYWALNDLGPGFQKMMEAAKKLRLLVNEDELLDIADDGSNDYVEIEAQDGRTKQVFNSEHVQRSALRIKARQFLIGQQKGMPQVLQLNHADANGNKLPPQAPTQIIIVPRPGPNKGDNTGA
jgi:hypothetical protein